ncbi:hypothetical protein KY330_01340 [Candidatus Woesearchaeota archaeon]|nr:hypothetical protein [Candidatus Woesearchaeota archaeon]
MEETPKPFGHPDDKGFYDTEIYPGSEVLSKIAQILVASHSSSLEYLALSGYIHRDYPAETEEKDFDWKWHILVGVDQNASEESRDLIYNQSFERGIEAAYKEVLGKNLWHHGPLKPVILDYHKINEEKIQPGTLLYSLVEKAVPLWEKPEILKPWGDCELSPFEHLQQYFFQFYNRPAVPDQDYVYVVSVSGDEAKRYIMVKED